MPIDKMDVAYRKILDRKRNFYIIFFFGPVVIGMLSLILADKNILFVVFFYVLSFFLFGFRFYFSVCPKCGGQFYGPKYVNHSMTKLTLFYGNACNQCGFPKEEARQ